MKNRFLNVSAIVLLAGCTTANFEPRAIQTHPDAAVEQTAALDRARGLFRSGNYALAAQQFRVAIRHDPGSAAAYNGLAACYDQMQRFDLADRYYQEALALAPTDHAVRHNYALSLRMQGRTEEAQAFEYETAEIERAAEMRMASAADAEIVASAPIAIVDRETVPAVNAVSFDELASPVLRLAGLGERSTESRDPSPVAEMRIARAPVVASVDRNADGDRTWSWRIAQTRPSLPRSEAWQRIARMALPATAANSTRPTSRRAIAALSYPAPSVEQTANGNRWSWRIRDFGDLAGQVDVPVRVLNAVGRRGQAARMRGHLESLGVNEITVGDAQRGRDDSVIYCSAGERQAAELLSRRLPFEIVVRERSDISGLVLVLGDNAVPFDQRLQARFITL